LRKTLSKIGIHHHDPRRLFSLAAGLSFGVALLSSAKTGKQLGLPTGFGSMPKRTQPW
jgi:hypothetical protein